MGAWRRDESPLLKLLADKIFLVKFISILFILCGFDYIL